MRARAQKKCNNWKSWNKKKTLRIWENDAKAWLKLKKLSFDLCVQKKMTETDEGYANKQIQVITILPMLVTLIKIQTSFVLLCSCLTLFKCTNLRVNIQRQFYRHLFLMFNLFFCFGFFPFWRLCQHVLSVSKKVGTYLSYPFLGKLATKNVWIMEKDPHWSGARVSSL